MPDDTPATAPADTGITIVTGREGPVDATEPVTCSYCGLGIVADDDHAPTCIWRPGKAGAASPPAADNERAPLGQMRLRVPDFAELSRWQLTGYLCAWGGEALFLHRQYRLGIVHDGEGHAFDLFVCEPCLLRTTEKAQAEPGAVSAVEEARDGAEG